MVENPSEPPSANSSVPPVDHSIEHMLENTAKLVRISAMIASMLSEIRAAPMDEDGLAVIREIYERSVDELEANLDGEVLAELERFIVRLDDDVPSSSELRVVQAQLVGWLEGMFQGLQLALMGQQLSARSRLEGLGGSKSASSGDTGQYL